MFNVPTDAMRSIKGDVSAVEWFLGRSAGPRGPRARRHSALARLFLISLLEDSEEAGRYLEEATHARMAIG